ncbi:PEMT/PEM2 methyltransferase family protein [Nitratireductor sp. StC3]|uniref:methyltransferase family protein n=1 Tax=Nitratireductor sp. StC3 TaxID=2126741 RepID=UPI000D0E1730|nr:PEMT/PEM2 methyltransferase family protein [Nitratireductor sp. StC3]PSM19498.1 isoprenylcysteine carboxylmethyltransferase family protein [Nitratireductor sp. StC3]
MKWLIPPILLVLTAVAMIAAYRGLPGGGMIPPPVNYYLGLPLVALGLALAFAGARRFRHAGTNIHTFHRPDRLITDGLYSMSRNPMYLGFALALLGFAIKLNTPINFALVAAFVLVTDLWYIRYEERIAQSVFGEAYRDYRRRTRRWI